MCGLYSCQHCPSLPSSPSPLPLLFLQVVYLISISSCCLLLWFSKMTCLDLFISCFQNLLHFLPPPLPLPCLEKKKTIPTRKMKNFPASVENLASLIPVKTVVSLTGNGLLQHLKFVLFFSWRDFDKYLLDFWKEWANSMKAKSAVQPPGAEDFTLPCQSLRTSQLRRQQRQSLCGGQKKERSHSLSPGAFKDSRPTTCGVRSGYVVVLGTNTGAETRA